VIRAGGDHDLTVMRHATLAALVATALLAGCGDGGDSATTANPAKAAPTAKPTTTITIANFLYDPTPATVKAGTKISIRNTDAAPHTITDGGSGKAFDSGTVKGKATGSLTIDKPGTYKYICEFHPFMKGELTVVR
jgi:plastocyanin